MSWALPFLLMQLFVKARSATGFVEVTQGNFLVFSVASLALFCLFVGMAMSRFSLAHCRGRGMRELKKRFLRGLRKAPG